MWMTFYASTTMQTVCSIHYISHFWASHDKATLICILWPSGISWEWILEWSMNHESDKICLWVSQKLQHLMNLSFQLYGEQVWPTKISGKYLCNLVASSRHCIGKQCLTVQGMHRSSVYHVILSWTTQLRTGAALCGNHAVWYDKLYQWFSQVKYILLLGLDGQALLCSWYELMLLKMMK